MTILSKNAIFRPKTELEAIARWSVDASREVDCAYFGNIGRNSGYFLLPIFLGSYLNVQLSCVQHRIENWSRLNLLCDFFRCFGVDNIAPYAEPGLSLLSVYRKLGT